MSLEKWHPLKELDTMRREMDRIWEELFPSARRLKTESPWRSPETGTASPAIDIIDKNNEVIVKAEMPGVPKESIDISFQDNTLTIKGDITNDMEAKDANYSYRERNYRSYSRSVTIPFKVNHGNIKANLKDGILHIHMPKAEEEQAKKIKVEIA